MCGDPNPVYDSINTNFKDSIVTLDATIPHNNSVLNLAFESDLNSGKGWWGIREITVQLLLCDKSCKSCTSPGKCINNM